jgi:hypothetical protein
VSVAVSYEIAFVQVALYSSNPGSPVDDWVLCLFGKQFYVISRPSLLGDRLQWVSPIQAVELLFMLSLLIMLWLLIMAQSQNRTRFRIIAGDVSVPA